MRALIAALTLALLAGCEARWTLDTSAFEGGAAPTEGRAIVTAARDGACDDEVLWWAPLSTMGGGEPVDLAAGEHCFAVDVWSADCGRCGHGESLVELPRGDEVITVVEEGVCTGAAAAACEPPRLVAPPRGSLVTNGAPTLRFALPRRAAAHHPRADRLVVRARACGPADPGCRIDGALDGAGEAPAIRVDEDVDAWTLPLSAVPGVSLETAFRVGWQVLACHGARCVPSEVRYFDLDRGPRDLDGDGLEEILVGQRGTLHVHPSAPEGEFVVSAAPCRDPDAPLAFAPAGDLDADGGRDLLATCAGSILAVELRADGLSIHEWARDEALDAEAPAIAAVGDADGDGHADVLVRTTSGAAIVSGADRRVRAIETTTPLEGDARFAGGGDVDGDGLADLLLADAGGASVCFGAIDGAPRCVPIEASGVHTEGALALVRDANGDGRSEIVLEGAGELIVIPGRRDGALTASHTLAVGERVGALVSGDIDGDGFSDLLVGVPSENRVDIYLGAATDVAFTAAPRPLVRRSTVRGVDEVYDAAREFGRAIALVRGRSGVHAHDIAIAGEDEHPGALGAVRVPLVYLYEWRDGPRSSFALSPPDLADREGFGGAL